MNVCDKAPDFKVFNTKGEMRSLNDYKGTLVLYFYPRDNTPGCTKEACSLRDGMTKFKKAGITVVGVSPNSVGSHQKFSDKFTLPFELLADTDKKLAKAYGVWGTKKLYGIEYKGIMRKTFVIEKGKIKHIFEKVDVSHHADQILSTLRG